MAAQQPPNSVAFRTAPGRVSQSANQPAQALQASTNIPDDLTAISSELEQSEHQPSNVMLARDVQRLRLEMQQRFRAL